MSALAEHHLSLGAKLAPDLIPLEYGDKVAEFEAALATSIILDRSHEGRILLSGRDRLSLVNRMSTNDVAELEQEQGCATVFTNPNARILFRTVCLNRPDGLLLISEAGQGNALASLLRRNIFFGDQVQVQDISATTAQFAIHGARAQTVMESLAAASAQIELMASVEVEAAGCKLTLARRKSISGEHWLVICPIEMASAVHGHLLQLGAASGLTPAGSLTYNALRIRSGRPAALELSAEYMPLEVGLWDEVSFSKGCYTGQEIIARMASRERLAKTLVKLDLASAVAAPAIVSADRRAVGKLTSSVRAANGDIYALAVLKAGFARPGTRLSVGERAIAATFKDFAGVQPPYLAKLIREV